MDRALRAGRHVARQAGIPADFGGSPSAPAAIGSYETTYQGGLIASSRTNGVRMLRAYRLLLRLYPRDYRIWFAAEMLKAFEQSVAHRKGRAGTAFAMVELMSLLRGAASEWAAKLTTNPNVRGRSLPDVMLMRPPGVT